MKDKGRTKKKLNAGIISIVLLSVALCLVTFALGYQTVAVEGNRFQMGSIKINLNDGKSIINEHEYLFEPGMTVEKEFFIENKSTWDVYYKLYFKNVEGGLADVLNVDILYGDKRLFSGTMRNLTRENVGAADDILKLNERRTLKVRFHYPESAGNDTKNQLLSFDLCADAVQTKNNPERLFS